MAELTLDDVRLFSPRLEDVDDDLLQSMLDAALAAARGYCGWPVTPVVTGATVVLDGPGGRVLSLPTLKLNTLTSVTEDGVAVNVSTLQVSKRRGLLQKPWPQCWTHKYGGITVVMTHGFTEFEAADWRQAVMEMVTRLSLASVAAGIRESADLIRKKVRDVEYQWSDSAAAAASTSMLNTALLSRYRILPEP